MFDLRVFSFAISAIFLVFPETGVVTPIRAATAEPSRDECTIPFPDDLLEEPFGDLFHESEEWAWNEICSGNSVDMRNAPGGSGRDSGKCNPADLGVDDSSVPPWRRIRPGFLKRVLTSRALVSAMKKPEVSISCAAIEGDVDLSGFHVVPGFLFSGHIRGDIKMAGSEFERSLNIRNATVSGNLRAAGLRTRRELLLEQSEFGAVDFSEVRADGSIVVKNSRFSGSFKARFAETGSRIFFFDNRFSASMDVAGTTTGGNFIMEKTTVGGNIDAELMSVGGNFIIDGGYFPNKVDISGSSIRGKLRITGNPIWHEDTVLHLHNVTAHVLSSSPHVWEMADSGDIVSASLTGFSYDRLEEMEEADAEWIIRFIESQPGYGDYYNPQPYKAFDEALQADGYLSKARNVRLAGAKHRHNQAPTSVTTLDKVFFGHAVYPLRCLYWLGGLVLITFVLIIRFSSNPEFSPWSGRASGPRLDWKSVRTTTFNSFFYSIENAIPLVRMSEKFRGSDHGNGLDAFLHVQKLLGFLLSLVFVGRIASLQF